MLDNIPKTATADGRSSPEEWIFLAMLALAALLMMVELLSLYSAPVPDSYLWWGDESWLMIEFRTQILTGVFRHPFALGSSLAQGSGILFGNMWIPAVLYGIPAALVSPIAMDIVLLGRTVTAILSFTLLIVLFSVVKQLTRDRLFGLFSVVLLLTSRSFLFTSHSARYDILSSLAIISGLYVLLRLKEKQLKIWQIAIIGFCSAATLLITIHVTLALFIPALATVLYIGRVRWPGTLAAFDSGCVLFLLLLLGITLLRGQPLFAPSVGGAFALNIHDIPALRFYSRSVQTANLIQRWHTFAEFGMGYVIVFATLLIFVVVRLVQGKINWSRSTTIILALVLFSWLEFESAAPTSYLIYILPVLSLISALAFKNLLPENTRIWIVAATTLILAALSLRDMPGPHGKGYQWMSENYQGVSAALSQVEDVDSSSHPLVLAFNPAVHEVLRDTNVRLMTTQFVEFPASTAGIDSILRSEHVNYALVYLSAIKPDYMREVGPIRSALDSISTPVWERPGYFTDIGRSYFSPNAGAPDTMRLYKLHD